MNPSVYVVKAGVTTPFTVSTYPCRENVTNSATWSSSNNSVASVNQQGYITTYEDGTATITATYNGMTATCNLTVDSRPLVRVVEMSEGDYFFVNFVNQKEGEAYRWKSVGCDLDLQENRSGYDIWNDDEDLLNTAERNYKYNCSQVYTPEQLALLYRLDPFGVVLYVKNYATQHYGGDVNELLDYKDRVYRAIFVVETDKFYFRPNDYGTPVFGSYAGWERKDVYSLAEMVFGKHTIVEFDLLDFTINVLKEIFSLNDVFETIFNAVELCQVTFFNGAIQGSVSSEISAYLGNELKVTDDDEYLYPESILERKRNAFSGFTFFSTALGILQAGIDAIKVLSFNAVDICRSVKQHSNYRVILQNNNTYLEIDDIVEICNN